VDGFPTPQTLQRIDPRCAGRTAARQAAATLCAVIASGGAREDATVFLGAFEEFVRDARYDSNDVAQLKQSIDELQRLRVISTGGDWVSEVPISSVRFHTERGRSTWVGIAVAPETHSLYCGPASTQRYSCRCSGS
jgi:hypothetical protein